MAASNTTHGLSSKIPQRIKSSPGKLEVPGKLILPNVKSIKKNENKGITWAKPL